MTPEIAVLLWAAAGIAAVALWLSHKLRLPSTSRGWFQ